MLALTSTNVLWIRNCIAHIQRANDVTRARRASGQPAEQAACGRRVRDLECMTSYQKIRLRESMRIEEQSCQVSLRSDLKRRSLRLF